MTTPMTTIVSATKDVLTTASPWEKAGKTRAYYKQWQEGGFGGVGAPVELPERPARPEKPELRHPSDMPRRGKGGTAKSKIALLHALAHIELNAVDLSWDVMGRFAALAEENAGKDAFSLPRAFYDDWMKVADDEAKHFLMLSARLQKLGSEYGKLPAHDGLWESAIRTMDDFAARLAIVPMVLEARGLDVTPHMISAMKKQDDHVTAEALRIIHDDEITHVAAGTVWFEAWCRHYDHDIEEYWQELVRQYFIGQLKPPFNHPSREEAGMLREWYEPLAEEYGTEY